MVDGDFWWRACHKYPNEAVKFGEQLQKDKEDKLKSCASSSKKPVGEVGEITSKNLKQLEKLCEATFPVHYSHGFYNDIVLSNLDYCRYFFFSDVVVGSICCRFDTLKEPKDDKTRRLYMMTLSVLEPYRNQGVGTALLNWLKDTIKDKMLGEMKDVYDIGLHVHTINEEALRFYKGHGFEQVETVPGYYPNLQPDTAYRLSFPLSKLAP